MVRRFRFAILGLLMLCAAWPAAAADPVTYRGYALGASDADVIARADAAPRDVKQLYERPALLEELSWRPRYVSGRGSADRDSVARIVFSFVDHQLFKMVIDYDRTSTEGLTRDDMIASLAAVYGPRSPALAAAPPRSSSDSLVETPAVIALWRQDDASITLQQAPYSGGFELVITSGPLEMLARNAQATAVTMDARDAPLREAARAKAQAEAEKDAAEKTRTTNKATFKP